MLGHCISYDLTCEIETTQALKAKELAEKSSVLSLRPVSEDNIVLTYLWVDNFDLKLDSFTGGSINITHLMAFQEANDNAVKNQAVVIERPKKISIDVLIKEQSSFVVDPKKEPSSLLPDNSSREGNKETSSLLPDNSSREGNKEPSSLLPDNSSREGNKEPSSLLPDNSSREGNKEPSSLLPDNSSREGNKEPSSLLPDNSSREGNKEPSSLLPDNSSREGNKETSSLLPDNSSREGNKETMLFDMKYFLWMWLRKQNSFDQNIPHFTGWLLKHRVSENLVKTVTAYLPPTTTKVTDFSTIIIDMEYLQTLAVCKYHIGCWSSN